MQTQHSDSPKAGGPETPARPSPEVRARVQRRKLINGFATGGVTVGGMTVIGSILAILFVITMEMLPLFSSASVTPAAPVALTPPVVPLIVGTDEYRETLWSIHPAGMTFYNISDGARLPVDVDFKAGAATVSAATPKYSGSSEKFQDYIAIGLSDGRAILGRLSFNVKFSDGKRKSDPKFKPEAPVTLDPKGRPVQFLTWAATDSGALLISATGPKEVELLQLKKKKTMMGEGKTQEIRQTLVLPSDGTITALAVDNRGDDLYAGLSDGNLLRVDLRNLDSPKPATPILVSSKAGTPVTALGFLNGDRTLTVGDAAGMVATWQLLRSEEGGYYMTKVSEFDPHDAPVTLLAPSLRDRGFVSVDGKGGLHLNHSTTSNTLVKLTMPGEPRAVAVSPRADGLATVDAGGKLTSWAVKNAHPETTVHSLFGKVWYEGYPKPEAVWQTSGSTEDFEPKFGLWPLIFGTLKGTFYALIMAVPLALLAALYVSQFMHPTLKVNVKPLIEVMAALPSVVLGFIAALWLAPTVERLVPGIFAMPFVISTLILLTVAWWRTLPLSFRQRFKHGSEVALIIPVVIIGALISFWLGGVIEQNMLGGDYQNWFNRVLGLTYDQRNSVVVGLAMGFAVIPIIFTIAEDSLSNVPPYLAAGSLALGATRWQTALKVVLPSASPGIFSAIMIGFGRAVGETMIVLMATGNTPVTNWNPFKGFRALSATIAVELPEAAEGGTLFRILFLAAFLLFLMTFTVNTAAEMIRLRLRKKFQSL